MQRNRINFLKEFPLALSLPFLNYLDIFVAHRNVAEGEKAKGFPRLEVNLLFAMPHKITPQYRYRL